jgi:TRAP-type C4-dicarboxylate transport system permease small subunit
MADSVNPAPRSTGESSASSDQAGDSPVARHTEAWFERSCRHLCRWALLLMIVVVGTDIFTRAVLNFSFEIADELGGYFVAAIAFLALPVTRAHNGFHRVEFIQDRLGKKGQAVSGLVLDLVAMTLATILLIYLVRYVHVTWESGSVAPTRLLTPLWIAQMPLVIGLLGYSLSLLRGITEKWSALRQLSQHASSRDR